MKKMPVHIQRVEVSFGAHHVVKLLCVARSAEVRSLRNVTSMMLAGRLAIMKMLNVTFVLIRKSAADMKVMTSEYVLLGISILAVAMLMAIMLEVSGIADLVRKWWKGEGAFLPKEKEAENEDSN